MKKRYICQAAVGLVCFLCALYWGAKERAFPALGVSRAERLLTEGSVTLLEGRVCKKRRTNGGWELCLDEVCIRGGKQRGKDLGKEKVLLYLPVPEDAEKDVGRDAKAEEADFPEGELPAMGQRICAGGKASLPEEAPNPGNFDQKFYYRKQGITALFYQGKVTEVAGAARWLPELLWRGKMQAARLVVHYLGERQGGLLSAMLLGDALPVPDEERELYQKSGIAHVLSLSGLHLSFLGLGLYGFLRKLKVSLNTSSLLASALMCLYAWMVGAKVSVIRATAMFVLRMGAGLFGREYDGASALAAAAAGTLLWNPLLLFDAGFLLSYGAVLGIYVCLPLFEAEKGKDTPRDRGRERSGRRAFCGGRRFFAAAVCEVRKGLRLSLAVHVMILPVLLYYYFEFCSYSFFWNLLVLPLMTGILGCGMAGLAFGGAKVLLGCFGAVPGMGLLSRLCGLGAQVFFSLAGKGLEFYGSGSELVLGLPGARLVIGKPQPWRIAGYAALMAAALGLLRRRRARKSGGSLSPPLGGVRTAGLLMAASVLLLCLPPVRYGRTEVVMLDVGQGDGFFIRGPEGGTYLIDGGSSSVSEVGRYRLEPFLKSQGVASLDYVWVSHGDLDHVNGIEELLRRRRLGVRIRRLVLPERSVWDETLEELADCAWEQGVPVLTIRQGRTFREGELQITCLWPETGDGTPDPGNQASMVLSLSYGSFDMLFTGDLEREGEEAFAARLRGWQEEGALPSRYEVLKVGHHGSQFATGDALLERVRPAAAWISAGENNRYGHPHPDVLKRLADWDASVYDTKDKNAVMLYTDGEKYVILEL